MADFAPNFTARYKLRYSSLSLTHTMQWRIARGAGATGLSNMILKVAGFLAQLAPGRYTDWTMLSATYAPEDSDIFLPAALPVGIGAGAATISGNPKSDSIVSLGFVGRSIAGQKARLFVFGTSFNPELETVAGDNFRFEAGENSAVDGAIAILNNGSPNVVGSDGNNVAWYSYANSKYNDYWLRRIR
jgi:hypothetical protein